MKPVRPRTAVVAGIVVTVVLGVVFQLAVNADMTLPRHSWWEAALVLLAGAALVSSGWRIRRYVDALQEEADARRAAAGDPDQTALTGGLAVAPPSPETARRTLVLSQAAAVGGSVLTGWYLAQAGVQLSRWSVPSVRSAVVLLGVLAALGVALSVTGFVVQRWCTLPEDQR